MSLENRKASTLKKLVRQPSSVSLETTHLIVVGNSKSLIAYFSLKQALEDTFSEDDNIIESVKKLKAPRTDTLTLQTLAAGIQAPREQ